MSRSYKNRKNKSILIIKDESSKFGKRMASKAVRRAKDVMDGCNYRKHYCSWNICEYRLTEPRYTADEFRKKWNKGEMDRRFYNRYYRTWRDAYRDYLKDRRMK